MPKVYFGHPKDGDSESSELRALGLKFNKSEPSRIGLIGLRSLEQPGYESYTHHLAGFMFANDTRQRQSLYTVGFPIKLPLAKCFPLLNPPLHVKVRRDESEDIKGIFSRLNIDFSETSQKTGQQEFSIFTANDAVGALGPIRTRGSTKSHAPSGQVSDNGFVAYLLAVRIFSSFFRTHLYPAYSAPTEIEDYTGGKRRIEEVEESRKRRQTEEGGVPVVAEEDIPMFAAPGSQPAEELEKIVLRYAKPQDESVLPWGSALGEIPTSHGIVLPFIHQLSSWDKEMVPTVMERHFLRCFGANDVTISKAFSSFVEMWKSECYSTYSGMALSHMAKVIAIAMPAQARPFPLFEDGQYRGCYLIGANFSVAAKGLLIRPEPFQDNLIDLKEIFGKDRFLEYVKVQIVSKGEEEEFSRSIFNSLADVHRWLNSHDTAIDRDDLDPLRLNAANANFQTRYLPVTVENVFSAISSAISGKTIEGWPLHHEALMSEDPFEINLSAFGPGVPSPHIPGGKEITSFESAPDNSTVCFRRCQLRSAVAEWRDVLEKKTVRNEPRNLNARFQFVKIVGKAEKGKWYGKMKDVVALFEAQKMRKGTKRGAESMKQKDDGGASLDDLFDF